MDESWGRGEREHVGLRLVHQWAALGEPGGELLVGLRPDGVDLVRFGVGEEGAAATWSTWGLGTWARRLRAKRAAAALVSGALEAATQRRHEAGVLVADRHRHRDQAALPEAGQ